MTKIIIVPKIDKKIFPGMSEKARARLQILDGQRRVKLARNQGYKIENIMIRLNVSRAILENQMQLF